MRLLFKLDRKNYDPEGKKTVRPSVRGIIISGGKIAMVHSLKYDYYKFPGGGMEEGENLLDTLAREVAEESGLRIIPESVREYGLVSRIEKGRDDTVFVQDNYYYLCDTENQTGDQKLDDYEADERFTLEWVNPLTAVQANRKPDHGPKSPIMIEREARVLEILMEEHCFDK